MITKLADIFKIKYGFYSEATLSEEDALSKASYFMKDMKRSIHDMYQKYVMNTGNSPIQDLAQRGLPFCQEILNDFNALFANLDDLTISDMFRIMNRMQHSIYDMRTDDSREVINAVWNAQPSVGARQKAEREQMKSRFIKTFSELSFILSRLLPSLQNVGKIADEVAPSYTQDEKKELSKNQLRDFSFTPEAVQLGLDNLDMLGKILEYPDLRKKLTTIINALKRGYKQPRDWKEFKADADDIISKLKARSAKDNSSLFEDKD